MGKKIVIQDAPEERRPVPRVSFGIDEAAVATGLSKSTLYELMKDGSLHFVKVGARRLLLASELEGFLSRLSKSA